MAKPVETGLKKGMEKMGNFLERLIGQAKHAKVTYETRVGMQPVLALESRLKIEKLKQILDTLTDRMVLPLFPSLKDKVVLEMGEGPLHYLSSFAERKTRLSSGLSVGEGPAVNGPVPSGALVMRGQLKSLPFESNYYDFVAARLTTPLQGDVLASVKEIGRVLAPDGEAILVDYHPFGLYAKSGTARMRSVESSIRGIEDYYKMCKLAGLTVTELKEVFLDDTVRQFFTTTEELAAFRDLKGTPLVLCLLVSKVRRGA